MVFTTLIQVARANPRFCAGVEYRRVRLNGQNGVALLAFQSPYVRSGRNVSHFEGCEVFPAVFRFIFLGMPILIWSAAVTVHPMNLRVGRVCLSAPPTNPSRTARWDRRALPPSTVQGFNARKFCFREISPRPSPIRWERENHPPLS